MKDLSIIIVSWNVKDLLIECLDSIFLHHDDVNLEVIVVDNNSTDGTTDEVSKKFEQVILVSNPNNAGFAKACNQGILKSSGKYFLFLNPDTKIFSDS